MPTVLVDGRNVQFFYVTYKEGEEPKLAHGKGGSMLGKITKHQMRIPATENEDAHTMSFNTFAWNSVNWSDTFQGLCTDDQYVARAYHEEATKENEYIKEKEKQIQQAEKEKEIKRQAKEKEKEKRDLEAEREKEQERQAKDKKKKEDNKRLRHEKEANKKTA